jgi:TonB family protein
MATMIADPPTSRSLGVGFSSNRGRTGNSEAWKQNIGTKQVPARLALLPEAKPNWHRVGLSAAVQLIILGFFVLVPILYPEQMKTAIQYSYTAIAQPITEIPVAPPPPPPPPPKVKAVAPKPTPPPPEPPKLNPQQPHIFADLTKPKPVEHKVEKAELKAPDMSQKFDEVKINVKENGPKRPKEDVKVGNLNSGSAAPATVVAPVEKVQTGGFGDPNGVAGKGDPKHATNVARLGSPALPGGEGYGNGTGGKNGIRGTVASTGFGNGTAVPPTGSGKKGTVVSTGFANAADATAEAPKKKQQAAGAADTSPTILDKPRPEYTAEGRSLKIEGDVVVDMVFLANGTIQINQVISGLGHGLDEAAVRSAQQIKFKPALRQGQPVDFPARVRIEFRLAY